MADRALDAPAAPRHGRRGRARAVGLLALATVLVAGCSNSSKAPAPTAAPRSGCKAAPTPGTTTESLSVGGRSRTYVMHIPTGIGRGEAAALVLNLHGSGSSAKGQEAFSGMDATADANHFVVVYPQGAITAGKGFDWNVPGVPLRGGAKVPANAPDDVAFLTQLVRTVSAGGCVDARRIYATGFSGGSRMTSQLACEAGTPLAAVAPVSGLRYPSPCANPAPVPVLTFHGTKDPVDPYGGHGEAYWTYGVPQAAQRWAAHDHCTRTATTTPSPDLKVISSTGCAGGASVTLDTVVGEGHEWPGGPHQPKVVTRLLGPQSDAVQADNVMWSFFAAHPKR